MAYESFNPWEAKNTAEIARINEFNLFKAMDDHKLGRLKELHGKIADTLHAASDEGHYNQLVDALQQYGYPVDKYRVRPNGPGWQALRDAALGEAGQMLKHMENEVNTRTKVASTFSRTPGTMTVPGAPMAPAQEQPAQVAPITPSFDFSAPKIQVTPESDRSVLDPIATRAASGQSPELGGIAGSIGPQEPLRQAGMSYQADVAAQPPAPAPAAPMAAAPIKWKGYYLSSDIPGETGQFVAYPEGFEPDEAKGKTGAHDPADVAKIKTFQDSFNREHGTNFPYYEFAEKYEQATKRQVPLIVKDGKLDFGEPYEGGKAYTSLEHLKVARDRLEKKIAGAGGKLTPEGFVSLIQGEYGEDVHVNPADWQFYQKDRERGGLWGVASQEMPDGTTRRIFRKVGNEPGTQAEATAKQAEAAERRLVPAQLRGFQPWFEAEKVRHKAPDMDRSEALAAYEANTKGEVVKYIDGHWQGVGAMAGTSAQRVEAMAKSVTPSDVRSVEAFRNTILKEYEGKIDPNKFTTLEALSVIDPIKRGGHPVVTPDGRLDTQGMVANSRADIVKKRIDLAQEALNLKETRFTQDTLLREKNLELAWQKYGFMKETRSLDAQERIARYKANLAADTKMLPRIAAGFTLMGHIKETYQTAASDMEATNEVIGWINQNGSWQNLRNEMSHVLSGIKSMGGGEAGMEAYAKSIRRSKQFIKISMGLASLDAEIDRAYFQGQGNLAEEARKRLDAMVLGLKAAPNPEVFLDGLDAMKGYVNEIIATPLPSEFATDPDMARERMQSMESIRRFARNTGGVEMPQATEGVHAASVPLFRGDSSDMEAEIKRQIKEKILKPGDTIEIMTGDGKKVRTRVK